MKLLAQHGSQPSDKIARGLTKGFIDGTIFSPRYIKPEHLTEKIDELRNINAAAEIYLDPEFYATRQSGTPNSQLRYLENWSYFMARRRRDLVNTNVVDEILRQTFAAVGEYNLTGIIAPNIYISRSFDSMEAGISINFIERAKEVYSQSSSEKPVFATLAVDRKAFSDSNNFKAFLNDLTAIKNPPAGFYVLIGGGLIDERSELLLQEIVSPEVIGGWMFLNYVLSINGYNIINGYSDILSPLLAACGGFAGATGWWTNLRMFSMGRYIKSGHAGGRRPNVKYLSKKLLNRITLEERRAYAELIPEVINNLSLDRDYDADSPPDQTKETLQMWESIASLIGDILGKNTEESIINFEKTINESIKIYASLTSYGLSEGFEANTGYLKSLREGINVFKQLAEL